MGKRSSTAFETENLELDNSFPFLRGGGGGGAEDNLRSLRPTTSLTPRYNVGSCFPGLNPWDWAGCGENIYGSMYVDVLAKSSSVIGQHPWPR